MLCCKLKECGTAFSRMLAIQFSKTEHRPSSREASLEPSPERRGVARTTVCVKEGGFYHRRPESVKRKFRAFCSKRLSTRGRPYLLRSLSPVNPSVEHRFRSTSGPFGGRQLLPSSSVAVKPNVQQPATPVRLSGFLRGGSFYLPRRGAVKSNVQQPATSVRLFGTSGGGSF